MALTVTSKLTCWHGFKENCGINKRRIGVKTVEGAVKTAENQVIALTPALQVGDQLSLQESVGQSLQKYVTTLDGQMPKNLYALVLAEVERPLIQMVLKLTNGNQSKAAIVLGLSRGTLRKKMAIYGLN